MSNQQTRGVRGAIVVPKNSSASILRGTRRLLEAMTKQNGIRDHDVASVFFTTTADLDAEFPALAARQLGWTETALLCAQEIPVPGALPRVVRVLIHWNTNKSAAQIVHVYLNGAEALRHDRVAKKSASRRIP